MPVCMQIPFPCNCKHFYKECENKEDGKQPESPGPFQPETGQAENGAEQKGNKVYIIKAKQPVHMLKLHNIVHANYAPPSSSSPSPSHLGGHGEP